MTKWNVFLVLITGAIAPPALADGAKLFTLHCAACHGQDARGNGPMTPALKQVPPDLTRLSAQAEGIFPTASVIAQIDGRSAPDAHGGSMPVYGWLLEGPRKDIVLENGTSVTTTEDIAQIVSWLQSVQSGD